VRYNDITETLKLATSGANKPKEQRYRPRRQQLPHKLAGLTFWLTRLENETRAMPLQKTVTPLNTPKAANAASRRAVVWRRLPGLVSSPHRTCAACRTGKPEQRQAACIKN